LNDVNTAEAPMRVTPQESTIPQTLESGKMTMELPARSFSLFRFE
jgi:alpha-L-arabinofuranosidase